MSTVTIPNAPPSASAALRLATRFSHVVEYEGGVILVDDDGSAVLRGDAIARLIRQIDGTKTAAAIAAEMAPTFTPDVVDAVLTRLCRRGIVIAGAADIELRAPEGVETSAHVRRLAWSIETAWAERHDGWCVLPDIERSTGLGREPCDLVVTDDYLRPSLESFARRRLAGGRPYLLARLAWESVWLGPFVRPRETACWRCLADRLSLNLAARTLLYEERSAGGYGPSARQLRPAAPAIASARLAGLLHGIAAGATGPTPLANTLLVKHEGRATSEAHSVRRLPRCSHCGTGEARPAGSRFRLRSQAIAPGAAGGFRTVGPATTLRRFEHQVSPLTGLVRSLDQVATPGVDCVHVYTANHAIRAHHATPSSVTSEHRDHSGGKGCSAIDAKVSALCEALERVSALHRGDESEVVAALTHVGPIAVSPNELMGFSPTQFASREAHNVRGEPDFQWIPKPLPLDRPICWTWARSLTSGDDRLVPTAAVYLGFDGEGADFCKADSNGLAGGNCLEEAILHGFLELVERDAVAIWWYNRLGRPGVDLTTFADIYLDTVSDCHGQLGRDLWALDLTFDIDIPCFVAVSAKADGSDIIFGFGAHLDAGIAMRRAVTEVNQMLPTVLKSPDDRRAQLMPDFRGAIEWWTTARLADHPYLAPAELPVQTRDDYGTAVYTDLLDAVDRCLSAARGAGLDVLVCDLTRPDVGLSVARVFVPGLRHFWRRLGPGRLYDIPVRMGLLDRATPESEMNPISMFV